MADSKTPDGKYTTAARLAANARHNEQLDQMLIKPYKDQGAIIRAAAAAEGKSLQRFILDIVMDYIEGKSAYDN